MIVDMLKRLNSKNKSIPILLTMRIVIYLFNTLTEQIFIFIMNLLEILSIQKEKK